MIIRLQALVILWVALFAPLGHAQFALLKPKAEAPKATAAADKVDPRAKAEAQLAEARRQQEAGQTRPDPGSDAPGLLVSDRQRILDRLVIAFIEQLSLLDELDELGRSPPEDPRKQALIADFAGPPPYSALRVDTVRDEHEAIKQRMQRLMATERALETLKAGQVEEQRRASEAIRLAEDKLTRAKGQEEVEKGRQTLEMATLRRQLAEANLANIGLGQERSALEMEGLKTFRTEIEHLLARVLPEQRLSKDELEQQQATLRKELSRLNSEIDTLVAANTRRAAERERLRKVVARADGAAPQEARQLQLLDAKLETERIQLMTLTWLQILVQGSNDAWAQRYVGLQSEDAATRQAVITGLSQAWSELASRKQVFDELQQAARVEVRDQELRVDAGTSDAASAAQQAELLATMKERLLAYQRVERISSRLQQQIQRWLDDFGFQGKSASSEDWKLVALQLAQTMKGIWNFEMFAVEDSTLIDGKTVTVSYGVTIGKSIGALLLFLIGYWLFALLARRLQRLMVTRFKVDEQVAIVVRRWAMIALGLVLLVFILNLARIPLTAFAFMGGALAIGIGFGTQTIIKNVISGIIILFERKIRVGDIIALGGMTGRVVAVDLRASTVRGFDGVEAVVPNSSFLENQVVNWTYSDTRRRREIRIGIAYGSPVREAAEIIASCAEDHGQVLKKPPPEVYFEDFADSALLMVLVYWGELANDSRRVDSDLRFAIEKRLGAAGIAIPFPQRDIRFDASQPLAVRIAPAGKDSGSAA